MNKIILRRHTSVSLISVL